MIVEEKTQLAFSARWHASTNALQNQGDRQTCKDPWTDLDVLMHPHPEGGVEQGFVSSFHLKMNLQKVRQYTSMSVLFFEIAAKPFPCNDHLLCFIKLAHSFVSVFQ